MIKLKINGLNVSVDKGTTILEAARKAEIDQKEILCGKKTL